MYEFKKLVENVHDPLTPVLELLKASWDIKISVDNRIKD